MKYIYQKALIDGDLLTQQVLDAGIAPSFYLTFFEGQLDMMFTEVLSEQDTLLLTDIVTAHLSAP